VFFQGFLRHPLWSGRCEEQRKKSDERAEALEESLLLLAQPSRSSSHYSYLPISTTETAHSRCYFTSPFALLCLFGGISIASWNSLDVLTVELYPSDKR